MSQPLAPEWIRLYRSVLPATVAAIASLVAERRRRKQLLAKGRQFTPRARAMWYRRDGQEAVAAVLIEKLDLANSWFGFDPVDRTKRQKAMVRGRAIYLLYEELKRPTRRGPKQKKPSFIYRPLIEVARARGRPRKYLDTSGQSLLQRVDWFRAGVWARREGYLLRDLPELKAFLRTGPSDEWAEINRLPKGEALRRIAGDDSEFFRYLDRNWPRLKRRQ